MDTKKNIDCGCSNCTSDACACGPKTKGGGCDCQPFCECAEYCPCDNCSCGSDAE